LNSSKDLPEEKKRRRVWGGKKVLGARGVIKKKECRAETPVIQNGEKPREPALTSKKMSMKRGVNPEG